MKIGLIARADKTGLAIQTYSFWRNMNPHRTLVVDLHYCSGKRPDMAMYPGAERWATTTYPESYIEPDEQLDAFLDDVDVVFTCETPYNYWLFQRAREKGVRTVLQYNYEFLEYLVAPDLPKPDLFAAPSLWYSPKVEKLVGSQHFTQLPVPVDLELLNQSGAAGVRTELNQILHTLGNPAMEDRNGTNILLEAVQYIESDVIIKVRAQRRFQKTTEFKKDSRVKFDYRGTKDFWEQYSSADDMYVLPRRFGGLCLPINESLGLGMPVLMSNCPPNSQWLPPDMLVTAKKQGRIKTRAPLYLYNTNPVKLAQRIDELVARPELVEEGSRWALEWSEANSWDSLRSLYESTLQGA